MTLLRFALIISLACLAAPAVAAVRDDARPLRVAVLQLGDTEVGRRAADTLAAQLPKGGGVEIVDAAQARAAARGVGYAGSLNMSLEEARDLGAAVGCDFLITGDAQVLRRSSSSVPVYHEAYASVLIVSARTGRLVMWDRPHKEAAAPEEAERLLTTELRERAPVYHRNILGARDGERTRRERELASEPSEIQDAPAEDSPDAKDFRAPHPYRRLRPAYPETASRAEAEATVDAAVEIDEQGSVVGVEIVRWGGFGLDESVLATVRQLTFRPATRAGRPIPVRVLLRYNFRRPAQAGQQQQQEAKEGEMKLGPLFKAIVRSDP